MHAMAQTSEQKRKCRRTQHPLLTQTTAAAAAKTMAQIFHH